MDDPIAGLGIDGLTNVELAGRGGFAEVYRAEQPAFRRTVAVKLLTAHLDDAAYARFERECQVMGSLSEHPSIVTIFDAGITTAGRPYLLMSFMPGGSLQGRIGVGPMSWQEAVPICVRMAGALEVAHRNGVVHRDVKPDNILLSSFGEPQLSDFGIARLAGGLETGTGIISASLAYAPPEVLDGNRPTVAADVYSLGATLYALIAGAPAFTRPTDESVYPLLQRIHSDTVPDLRSLGVPPDVAVAIEAAMQKNPADRPASALEFGKMLQAAERRMGRPETSMLLGFENQGAGGAVPAVTVTVLPEPHPPPAPAPAPAPAAGALPVTTQAAGVAPPPVPTQAPAVLPAPTQLAPAAHAERPAHGRRRGLLAAFVVAIVAAAVVAAVVLTSGGGTDSGSDASSQLKPGDEVQLALGAGDEHIARFTFAGRAGAVAGVELRADDFEADPMVTIFDPDGELIAGDDDLGLGPADIDAFALFAMASNGTYTIEAIDRRGTMTDMTLELTFDAAPLLALPVVVDGSLSIADSDRDLYVLEAEAGAVLDIRMAAGLAGLDPRITVLGPVDELASDDDSGGGPHGADAYLQVTAPVSGFYRIVAGHSDATGGPYTLTVYEVEP